MSVCPSLQDLEEHSNAEVSRWSYRNQKLNIPIQVRKVRYSTSRCGGLSRHLALRHDNSSRCRVGQTRGGGSLFYSRYQAKYCAYSQMKADDVLDGAQAFFNHPSTPPKLTMGTYPSDHYSDRVLPVNIIGNAGGLTFPSCNGRQFLPSQ